VPTRIRINYKEDTVSRGELYCGKTLLIKQSGEVAMKGKEFIALFLKAIHP